MFRANHRVEAESTNNPVIQALNECGVVAPLARGRYRDYDIPATPPPEYKPSRWRAKCFFLFIVLVVSMATFELKGLKKMLFPSYIAKQADRDAKADAKYCLDGWHLERHDEESLHGDVCRNKETRAFRCPEDCRALGKSPYCAIGRTNEPCRVPRGKREYAFRCDPNGGADGGGVCLLAIGHEDFKGKGKYHDDTCDGACGKPPKKEFQCKSDVHCSLAGECNIETGVCTCDAWTKGSDCSYLNFAPVDPTKIGYVNELHSSWGGNAILGTDQKWHMYVSEIICDKTQNPEFLSRCGLDKWQTNSQVAHVVSDNVDGPYKRVDTVLPTEHHNPTVQVSPVDGSWNLYVISGPNGPIDVISSTDEGASWSNKKTTISKQQNPGPFMHEDGSVTLYHRGDNAKLPSPTCSNEYIGRETCKNRHTKCTSHFSKRLFDHTGEDPSVFRDHRGNYHMLFNALPYHCVPKVNQGGHAWSRDGIHWSSKPRVGAFTAEIDFAADKKVNCERRERPQMIMDPTKGGKVPLALVTAVVNCENMDFVKFYRGGTDSFTLVQMMNQQV